MAERDAQRLFVIDDQDALAVATRQRRRRHRDAARLAEVLRQKYLDAGATTDLALDSDRSVVVAYDAMNHRQAEAGAFALLLGREERLENPLDRRLVHAAPGVGHGDARVAAGPQIGTSPRQLLVDHRQIHL